MSYCTILILNYLILHFLMLDCIKVDTIWCCIFSCCTILILHYLMLHYLISNILFFNGALFNVGYLLLHYFNRSNRYLIFWYLVWVFGRSNCAKFQIAFPYRNWFKNIFKVLWQSRTMKKNVVEQYRSGRYNNKYKLINELIKI